MGTRTGRTDADSRGLPHRPKSVLREYVEALLLCVIAVLFVRAFVVQQSEIPSGSMEDTVLPGDYILVNRFSYASHDFDWERALIPSRRVERGDLVVFRHPHEPERDYIKRVIALPGETVELRQGLVLIDGLPLDEPYVDPLYRDRANFAPARVPDGEYFLMGDHRNLSSDSREWGTVAAPLIKGRAFMILFSTSPPPIENGDPGRVTALSLVRKVWYLAARSRWDRALRTIE